jgi:hypothetical protein
MDGMASSSSSSSSSGSSGGSSSSSSMTHLGLLARQEQWLSRKMQRQADRTARRTVEEEESLKESFAEQVRPMHSYRFLCRYQINITPPFYVSFSFFAFMPHLFFLLVVLLVALLAVLHFTLSQNTHNIPIPSKPVGAHLHTTQSGCTPVLYCPF